MNHRIQIDPALLEVAAATLTELHTALGATSIGPKAADILKQDTRSLIDQIDDTLANPDLPTPKTPMAPIEEPIDTLHGHTRHMAIIARDGHAETRCGKRIIYYFRARHSDGLITSYFHSDGTRWAKPCKKCLPEDHAAYKAEKKR